MIYLFQNRVRDNIKALKHCDRHSLVYHRTWLSITDLQTNLNSVVWAFSFCRHKLVPCLHIYNQTILRGCCFIYHLCFQVYMKKIHSSKCKFFTSFHASPMKNISDKIPYQQICNIVMLIHYSWFKTHVYKIEHEGAADMFSIMNEGKVENLPTLSLLTLWS